MVCIRCQKRPAIIFVQRMENGQMKNEGYCLHCAREMHIKPVDDLMKQFGMSDEDMDAMEDRMENMMQEMGDMSNMNPFSMMMGMGQPDQSEEDGDLVPGSSATFPLGVNGGAQNGKNEKKAGKNDKKPPRRKFLDTYCENLTRKAREGKLDDIIGRDREIYRTIQILSRRQKNNPCLIGEAGVGKTAIAEGIAERIAKGQVPAGLQDKEIFLLDLTSLVAGTQFRGQFEQRVKGLLSEVKAAGNVILFIDEIHRFNKGQQDYLLPYVEDGTIILIGATTENPYFEVNGALISRSVIFELKPIPREAIKELLKKAVYDTDRGMGAYNGTIDEDALDFLADISGGDARHALNAIELGIMTTEPGPDGKIHITLDVAQQCIQKRAARYDKNGDNHYDTISAFIKSIRGTDPDAALYYLARMLYAGEDIRFIARRIMISAAEDVGTADPMALNVAVSAAQAVERIGMPEAQIILAEAVAYVASAPKSNASYMGLNRAMDVVEHTKTAPIPNHLKDAHYKSAGKLGHGLGYLYSHDYPHHYVRQQYLPDGLTDSVFYEPTDNGKEKEIAQWLHWLKENDE